MRLLSTLLIPGLFSLLLIYGCGDGAGEDTGTEINVDVKKSPDAGEGRGVTPDGQAGSAEDRKILDQEPASGSWFYRETPEGGVAMFGEPETEPRFSVRCNGRTIEFDRAGRAGPDGVVEMTIHTSLGNTRIDASPVGTELPILRGTLPAGDSWIQRLADATGPIAVSIDDGPPLVMPHHPSLVQLLRECGRLSAGDELPIDQEATPEEVLDEYYAAIRRGDYRLAYRLWNNGGRASGQTYRAFASGFENTASTSVKIGTPSEVEGAAGSQFVTLPVEVDATTRDGIDQHFEGSYVLQRSMVEGSGIEGRSWRIYSADIVEK